MAHLNPSLVILLALVALVPTALLAQDLGINLGIEIQGYLYSTETGNPVEGGPNAGAANANVTLACENNMVVASGVTDANGRYKLSAQVKPNIVEALNANQCGLSVKLPVPNSIASNGTGTLNASVRVNNVVVSLVPGNFTA